MKKLIILVTALCLLLVLTGCASSNPADVKSTTEPGVAADSDITADPAITALEETAPVEVEVRIGDSLLAAGESLENILDE